VIGKALPFDEYSKVDGINWSTLKEMRRSPLHYRYRLEHPREDTPAFARGRAGHTAVFEPRRFLLEYALFEGAVRRGKAWDAFKAQHTKRTILKKEEYETCLAVSDAVHANPIAAEYLKKGKAESTITWTDTTSGLACKGRPDWISESKPAIVDLKTTSDVDPRKFASTAARLGYHCQLAFYREGLRAMGTLYPVVIIAVEATAPHDVAVYEMDEDSLYAGWEETARMLDAVARCRRENRWPGRFESQQTLRLPQWLWNDEDDARGLDLVVSGQSLVT
jgi:exodeoxyribonuclease VIII